MSKYQFKTPKIVLIEGNNQDLEKLLVQAFLVARK